MAEQKPPNTRVGKYELEEFLGGGMSHVYRAKDSVLGRRVAVKILTELGHQAQAGYRGRRKALPQAALPAAGSGRPRRKRRKLSAEARDCEESGCC